MDPFAAAAANLLTGNAMGEAVLEITLLGPLLKFLSDTVVSITGADLSATLGNNAIPPWSSVPVFAGQELAFGRRKSGARLYLAVRGGLDVPIVLGSRSTDLKAAFGGLFGRPIKAGDRLGARPYNAPLLTALPAGRRLLKRDLAALRANDVPFRVLRRPDAGRALDEAFETLMSCEYIVRPDSDRMGFRLRGPKLTLPALDHHQWSEPVVAGTVQVPYEGDPIVLMADRQTVGGYPIIGTIISVDRGRLAQIAPSETVQFGEIDLAAAQLLITEERRYLQLLQLANR
jgi:antagonist of KipI